MEYANVDYEVREINFETWTKEKPALPLDYPNLPHIVDGDIKMSESMAICKYISRKCDLMPKTDEEIRNADMAEGAIIDFRILFFVLMFNTSYDTDKDQYPAQIKAKLVNFERVFTKQKWLVGNRITWMDFVLYESLDVNSMFVPGILDDFPKVKEYKNRIESFDKIAAYRKSDRFKAFPVTGGPARWGKQAGETIYS